MHGCTGTGVALTSTNNWGDRTDLVVGQVDNNAGYGFGPGAGGQRAFLRGTTLANNATADLLLNSSDYEVICHGCTLSSTTQYSNLSTKTYGLIVLAAEGGVVTAHRRIARHMILASDTTTRHTASGIAWKMTLQASAGGSTTDLPVDFKLAEIAVEANLPVTITCWLRRDSTSLSAGISTKGGWLAGVVDARAAMTAAPSTWEQITLTVTPTVAGVLPIYGWAFGAINSAWWDDMEVSQ